MYMIPHFLGNKAKKLLTFTHAEMNLSFFGILTIIRINGIMSV